MRPLAVVHDAERDVEDWLLFQQGYEFGTGGGANEVSASMLSLPVVAIAEISSPAELFECAFYKTRLSAGNCIGRQVAKKKVRTGSHGKLHEKTMTPAIYQHCASGRCEQGNEVKARLVDYAPPATEAAQEAERNRALAPARLKHAEDQLAANEPTPASPVAEDLEAAAAVEAANKSWRTFQEEKERQREEAIAAAPPKKPRPPHPLSRRAMVEEAVGAAADAIEKGRIPTRRRRKKMRHSPLHDVSDDDFRKAYADAGGNISALAEKYGCAPPTVKSRAKKLHLNGRAAKAREVRRATNGAMMERVTPGAADFEEMLKERIAYHLAEMTRYERALAALKA